MTAQLRGAAAEAAVEDFLWLLGVGEHVDRALRRVGLSATAMDKLLGRVGGERPACLAAAVWSEIKTKRGRHG